MSDAVVDVGRLRDLEAARLVNCQRHPEFPLLVWNYTPQCQYAGAWDADTLMCRGLVTDEGGAVVARPFGKFFNLHEHAENPALPRIDWSLGFTATEKVDGSLGILYRAGGRPRLATRGSFTSEQAREGEAILRERGYRVDAIDPAWTLLFEIVYPGNRVVVDYGGRRDLILLDAVHVAGRDAVTHAELSAIARQVGCPVVRRVDIPGRAELEAFAGRGEANAEGVVVRFDDGLRVKVKFAEYVRLHRLVTGVQPRHVWEALQTRAGLAPLLDRVPDEFNGWVRATAADITARFDAVVAEARGVFAAARARLADAPRRDYAADFTRRGPLAPMLFKLLDGRDPADVAWKMVRPGPGRPFKAGD